MKNLKIGILTTFSDFDPSYSLVSVVRNQLEMLVRNGYSTVLFTLPQFKDDAMVPEGVEIRKIVPQFILEPYGKYDLNIKMPDDFESNAKVAQDAFEVNMQDVNIILTHDIFFINSFLIYNKAVRDAMIGKLQGVRWFNWIHSGPSERPSNIPYPHNLRYSVPPNSKMIYMNDTDVLKMAEMYGGTLGDFRVVKNPMDLPEFLSFHPLTKKIYNDYKLYNADIIQVYPLSTPRMESNKQISKVIKVFGKLKKQGQNVRLIICNAHANAENEKKDIESILRLAEGQGLTCEELIFTSLVNPPDWEHGVPHKVVSDLFLLSNLFIFPSVSENCPLILLEAAACKNLLVLNNSFPVFKDFFGGDALYFEFGSLVKNVQYKDEENYYFEVAMIILGELNKDKSFKSNVQLRKNYNLDYIFKNKLEPLFYEEWK
jgi:glycosyltransferase involved in cell wall biosynthesis